MTEATPSVTLSRIVPLTVEAAFDAWLDPRVLARFMCPTAGSSVPKVEVDARVGGYFLILMRVGEQDLPHHGEYLTIDRPARLVFTWRSPAAGEGSHVALRFEPLPGDRTHLTLEHFGLASEDACARHHSGWTHILEVLSQL